MCVYLITRKEKCPRYYLSHKKPIMKTTLITAPENAIYLSEFMTSLPNGLLNKQNTGAGAMSQVN